MHLTSPDRVGKRVSGIGKFCNALYRRPYFVPELISQPIKNGVRFPYPDWWLTCGRCVGLMPAKRWGLASTMARRPNRVRVAACCRCRYVHDGR